MTRSPAPSLCLSHSLSHAFIPSIKILCSLHHQGNSKYTAAHTTNSFCVGIYAVFGEDAGIGYRDFQLVLNTMKKIPKGNRVTELDLN